MAEDEAKESRLRTHLRTALFYTGIFLVVFCGGVIFFMPFLLATNFCVSLVLIAQSLIRVGPLPSTNGHRGRGGAVHLCLIFPASMIFTFVLPSYFVLSGRVRDAVLSLPKRFGSPKDAEHVDSTEKVVIWLARSSWSYFLSMGTRTGATIGSCFWAESGSTGRVSSTNSTTLWRTVNSAIVDFVVLRSMNFEARVLRVLRWVQSLIAVIVIAPGFYFGSEPEGSGVVPMFFSLQLQVWLAPVGFLMYFLDRLKTAASELDSLEGPEFDTLSGTRKEGLVIVLVIEPGHREQPICCRLKVNDLASTQSIQYEALSCVWGPPGLAEAIQINHSAFAVSTALFQALLHLRRRREPRAIWIDAICINQADLAERSAQVLLMQHIYSMASGVVVWLDEVQPWGLGNLVEAANSSLEAHNCIHYGAVKVLSNLLRRPWWTRVWVTEELVLARDVTVCCGSQTLGWDRFCWFMDSSALLPLFPSTGIYIDEFRALRDNWRARTTISSLGDAPKATGSEDVVQPREARASDLLSLIYDFRSRRATEPRDKVFAFQGLAQGIGGLSLASGQPIDLETLLVRPDYERRSSLMSTDLARRHIRRTKSLSVMALAEWARQTSPSMPMDTGLRFRPFWTGLPGEGDDNFSSAGNIPVQALPPEPDSLTVPPDWKHLDLDGYANYNGNPHKLDVQVLSHLSDNVVETGPLAGGSINALVNSTMKVISRQASTMVNSFQGRNAWDSVLPTWRRMAMEAHKSRKSELGQATFEEEFQLSITAGEFSAEPSSASQQIGYTSSRTAEASTASAKNQAYIAAREATCANRASFVTAGGHFGIGPPDVQVGDEVCVAIGIQVPVILRKVGSADDRDQCPQYDPNDWLFIGKAYLHQKMVYHGDLAEEIRSGSAAVETRVLT
ncbi:hypothetical protein INS49_012886 [Diaporthe citri]|uniref:uncharacterized protein n=1 Tax=Diaporthe citri TaxID=83186 RepID=UPI001C822A3E|nr:uncharacterized protein INS49_012886 [Diaporthe citri]KAG6359365.1 hypothetical protein INS49_012886 [Diaporthe citri]